MTLMSMGLIEDAGLSLDGLCDILEQINPDASLSSQGLSQRINSGQAVSCLETVLKDALQKNISAPADDNCGGLLSPFRRVLIEDSTYCSLNERLAEEFKGSGGSASRSSVKIDLIYEFKNHMIQEVVINSGNVPDQSVAGSILNHIQPGDLILRDMGYFITDILTGIRDREAFYLSRLPKGINIYLSDSEDASPVDLPQLLNEKFPCQAETDWDVYIGDDRMPCRLIAYRLPDEIVRLRRRKARRSAAKKGKTPSGDYLRWLDFGFYITDVPRKVWSSEVIGTVYRLRWQIELIFKSWKSLLNIHVLKGTRSERVKCLIYGRLTAVTVMTMCYAYAFRYAKERFRREVSMYKLFSWLKRNGRLFEAVRTESSDRLFEDMEKNIHRFCKQNRKRKTTLRLIEEQIGYLDTFSGNDIKKIRQNYPASDIITVISSILSPFVIFTGAVFAGIVLFFKYLTRRKHC